MQTIRMLLLSLAVTLLPVACSKSGSSDAGPSQVASSKVEGPVNLLDLPIGLKYVIVDVFDNGFVDADRVYKKFTYRVKALSTGTLTDAIMEMPASMVYSVGTEFSVPEPNMIEFSVFVQE